MLPSDVIVLSDSSTDTSDDENVHAIKEKHPVIIKKENDNHIGK